MQEAATAANLSEIVERLTEGIVLLDRAAHCRYVNPEAARIFGGAPGDFIGKAIREVAPARIGSTLEDALPRILASEEVLLARSHYAREHWYEALARPMGEQILLLLRDITERLQAESARRQSEERFRLLVDGVRDYAILMVDPKAQVASWNAGAERLFGYRAEEVLGKHVSIFFAPEDTQPNRHQAVASALASMPPGASIHNEGWCVRKDGSRLFTRSCSSSIYDELGYPTGFAVVVRDETERRELEERLRTSEERRRLAVEAAEVGTWEYLVHEDRYIADERTLALFGVPKGAEPNFAEYLELIHPDDRERVRLVSLQTMTAATGYGFEHEYRVSLPGGVRWIEVHGKVVVDEAGRRRILGALRETTRRHRHDEFRQLAAGLIAHDLRSPLTTIKLSGQVLVKSGKLPAAAVHTVEAILRNTDQMASMTQQLLDYVQAQFGGGLPLDRERVDLVEVSRHVVADAQATHPNREIRLVTDGDCGGPWDRTRLTEVLSNLVSNALKHGQPGDPIDVVAHAAGDAVVVQVHNNGPPIPQAILPVIFDPFSHGSESLQRRERGETSIGLGLYVTREIVAAHGGDIEVSSSAEEGTTFTVRLPRLWPAGAAPTGSGCPAGP